MNFAIAIIYAPEGQRPLSVAKIQDPQLLGLVAKRALLEAQAAAIRLRGDDPVLGAMQQQEVEKLRRVLSQFVSNTSVSPPARSLM
jgi:hypothetical protein